MLHLDTDSNQIPSLRCGMTNGGVVEGVEFPLYGEEADEGNWL
jgi:hypothetical protein